MTRKARLLQKKRVKKGKIYYYRHSFKRKPGEAVKMNKHTFKT